MTRTPKPPPSQKAAGEAGALASFIGTVRDSAHGGEVSALDLEAYPGFTEKQIAQIEADARARFDVIDTLVIHRHGRMAPGEAIVLVAALLQATPPRSPAGRRLPDGPPQDRSAILEEGSSARKEGEPRSGSNPALTIANARQRWDQ